MDFFISDYFDLCHFFLFIEVVISGVWLVEGYCINRYGDWK